MNLANRQFSKYMDRWLTINMEYVIIDKLGMNYDLEKVL